MVKIKECFLKISSNVINLDDAGLAEGDSEKDSFCVSGFIKTEEDAKIISYVEKRNDTSLSCDVRICGDEVKVSRRGDVVCDMLFSVGKTHKTVYECPPFKFDMEIRALRVDSSVSEDGGSLSLLYSMTIGGAKKRCRMKIELEDV